MLLHLISPRAHRYALPIALGTAPSPSYNDQLFPNSFTLLKSQNPKPNRLPPPALNTQVRKWIDCGVHLHAGEEVYISWGRRLLLSPGLVYLDSQRLILKLLADYPDEEGGGLVEVVEGVGGIKELFLRFFQHYKVGEGPAQHW